MDTERELAQQKEGFFRIYDTLPIEDQRTMNSYLRHIAGEQLRPEELEKLRTVCRNFGGRPEDYRL